MAYTNQQIVEKLNQARLISERIHAMRRARINKLCALAGIGTYHGCVVNNAMISYRDGQPWRKVDYRFLKKAAWLDRQPTGLEIRDRFYRRMIADQRAA